MRRRRACGVLRADVDDERMQVRGAVHEHRGRALERRVSEQRGSEELVEPSGPAEVRPATRPVGRTCSRGRAPLGRVKRAPPLRVSIALRRSPRLCPGATGKCRPPRARRSRGGHARGRSPRGPAPASRCVHTSGALSRRPTRVTAVRAPVVRVARGDDEHLARELAQRAQVRLQSSTNGSA